MNARFVEFYGVGGGASLRINDVANINCFDVIESV